IPEEMADREAFDLQLSRLSVLEPVLGDYLEEAARPLRAALASAEGEELDDVLHALDDLRAEAGGEILEVLRRPACPQAELAVGRLGPDLPGRGPRQPGLVGAGRAARGAGRAAAGPARPEPGGAAGGTRRPGPARRAAGAAVVPPGPHRRGNATRSRGDSGCR